MLLAVPLLITACGGDSGDEGDKGKTDGESGGTFSMYISEPEHLIPQNTNESGGSEVLNALFTGLVTYDAGEHRAPDGRLRPRRSRGVHRVR